MAKEEQIKSQIILEGEKEYRAACKGINTSLREIGSEMKLATAEFGDNAESIEALTRKQDILQKQLDEQAKKAKAAEAALKKMREGGIDPTDPAYQKMQTNLNNTRAEMVKVQRELDDTSKKLKSSKIDWESVGDTVGKVGKAIGDTVGKVGKAIGAGVAAMGAAIGAAATAFLGLAESTREARENMGKLEAGFTTAGHSAEDAKNTYTELYGILGDDGQATEAAAHLAQLTNNEQELATWTDIATGVYATFGDSLPIENLTEAANETAKTGQITGGLADALNWAGVSEDEFQSKLDACTTEQERQALITETLNGLYSDAAEAYREVNGDIIEAQKATANLNSAMAALGAIAEPIVTKLKQLAADLLQQITPFVELIGTGLTGALEGAEGAAQQLSEGLLGLVTFIVEQLGTMLPTFLEFALQMIGTLATGIAQALPTLVPTIVSIITQLVQTLIDNIPMLIDAALQLITGLAQGIINAIPVLVAALPQVITSLVNGLLAAIPQIIQAGIDLLTSLISALPEIITTIVSAIPEIINGIITALLENIPQIVQAGIDLLTSLISALPEIITTIVSAIPEIINGIITALLENIPQIVQAGIDLLVALIQALPQIITTIVQAIPQIISGIVNALVQNIPQIIQAGVQLFVSLIQNLPTIIVEIVKAVPQIVSGIVQAFASLGGEMVSAGANLLHGLWEGISSAASWLWDKVTGWASSLVSGIKSFFGIHSPSTVFAEIGTNMGEGVGVGFGESMDGVSADMTAAMGGAGQLTAAEAVRAVNDGIMANIEGLSGAINAIVEKVITGLNAQAQRLIQAGQDFGNNIASGLINGIPQITAKIPQITQSIITAFNAQNQKFIDAGVTIDRNIASGMVQGIPQITSKVAQIVQPILTELRSFVSDFTAAGEEMVRGIWQGFQNMSSWLESRVRSMMREIVAAVEDEMDIASPSKVFAGIGEYMAQGLGEGFGREMRNVEKTIRKATDSAVPDDPEPRPRTGGGQEATFKVVQNIYANDTSYAQQQREAARQFRMIAREVMT